MNAIKKISKCIFITGIFILIQQKNYAISYQFTATTGAFTPNVTPTLIFSAGTDDSYTASAINIGFSFNFGGCTTSPFTQFKVSSNGWMTLGTGATGSQATNNMSWTNYGVLLAPLWDDLAVGTGGTVNYKLTGSSPNRVLTVEWINMKWVWSASNPAMSFQVKLYESNGMIEYIYRQETGTTSSPTASIGINGGVAGDYYSLNNTSASPVAVYGTAFNSLNTKPATGQIYRWELPATMNYISSNVFQASTANVYPNSFNNEIIGIQIDVSGGCTPFDLTQISMNMSGTTSLADVTNIDIYYTGNSSSYAPTTFFGNAAPAGGTINITGSQTLQNGSNYFWIVYDVPSTAVIGNFLDAGCTQIIMNGTGGTQTPTGNPPAGNRPITTEPPSFAKWIDMGWAKSVIEPSDNSGLIWVGSTSNTYSSGSGDAYIIKTNYDLSNIYWSTVVGFANNSERINKIVETSDGFVGVGYTSSIGAGSWDIFVVKINFSGVMQWTKTIGSASTEEGYGITTTSDGHIAICGYRGDLNDGYFAKLDNANGNILVQRSISATGATYFTSIIQTADGGFLMGGYTNSDFYLAKITSTYTFDWGRRWGGGSSDYIYYVLENSPNDYTVGGHTYSYGAGSNDGYVMRFTWTGSPNVTWVNAYGTSDGNRFNDGVKTLDGGYVMSGLTSRLGDPLDDEAFITKITNAGNLVFAKSIGTVSSTEDQEGYGIASLSDGSYASAGLHNNVSGANFYMIKMTGSGYNCAAVQDNGGITNLIAPTLNSDGFIATPTFSAISQSPTIGTGGVIANGCGVLLPIELLDFYGEASGDVNILHWITASEINSDYFILESSADNLNWKDIGRVEGAGHSNQPLNYILVDDNPFLPITYYRLRMVDMDLNFKYSETIALRKDENDTYTLNVYPNPTNQYVNIYLPKSDESYTLYLYDINGKIIFQTKIIAEASSLNTIDLSPYNSGLYFLSLSNRAKTYSVRISKF